MLIPKRRSPAGALALGALVLAVTAAGALGSLSVYRAMDESGRRQILERAATIAEAVPGESLAALTGTEADLGTPAYERVKDLLVRERLVNTGARFVYLMGKDAAGGLFFYADSEEPQSEDYSPPGQAYYEASDAMRSVFSGARVSEGPDEDRWGTWISAYAPVKDEAGRIVALLGVDLPADAFLADLYVYSALPLIAAAVLLCALMLLIEARRREAARIEERETFLSIASHEIRSPLTGMAWGLAALLKSAGQLPASDRERVALMHESALRLIARLNALLDLSGAGRSVVTKEHLDASELLRGIGTMLTLPAQSRHVALSIPTDPIPMKTDRQILHHILFNLVGNAVKYTREGTKVSVAHAETDGMHEFRVADEGDGVPEEERAKIFRGYYRGKGAKATVGTGLGLYMAKRAAEMLGGTITLESETGKGSTFVAKIPG